jgi:hypothetical protein
MVKSTQIARLDGEANLLVPFMAASRLLLIVEIQASC